MLGGFQITPACVCISVMSPLLATLSLLCHHGQQLVMADTSHALATATMLYLGMQQPLHESVGLLCPCGTNTANPEYHLMSDRSGLLIEEYISVCGLIYSPVSALWMQDVTFSL